MRSVFLSIVIGFLLTLLAGVCMEFGLLSPAVFALSFCGWIVSFFAAIIFIAERTSGGRDL